MSTETTPDELDRVLGVLSAAAQDFADLLPEERAVLLDRLADDLDAAADELVPLAARESRLPEARLVGEVARTTGQLRFFGAVLRDGTWLDAVIDTADPSAPALRPDVRSANTALGVALVFAASNFPFAFSVAGGDTAAALAAGCPVLLKAHPGHPELSARVGELVGRVFGNRFALVTGVEAGRQAVQDPRVRVSAFTGSVRGGRALYDLAAGRPDPIPFYGELGSLNPVVVTPGAVAARAADVAEGFVASFTLGAGQFCTKPGLLFAPVGSDLPGLIARAARAVPAAPMLGDWVRAGHDERREALMGAPGMDVLTAGDPAEQGPAPAVLTTTVRQLLAAPEAVLEECFGPTTVLVEYDDLADVPDVLALVQGSLTATVHAEADEDELLRPVVSALRALAGRLVWNGWPTGVRVSWAMNHGGPWPASTAPGSTSVGAAGIRRFVRPVAHQDAPAAHLPPALQDRNTLDIPRRIDGVVTRDDVPEARS